MTTAPTQPDIVDFDFYDPAIAAVTYETFAGFRSQCPVGRSEKLGGYWLITGYDEVRTVLTDHDTYSSRPGPTQPVQEVLLPPIDQDPPNHREYRKFLNHYFSRTKLAAEEPELRAAATELIEGFIDSGSCDIMADFAAPFTAMALAKFIFKLEDGHPDMEIINRGQEVTEKITTEMNMEAWAELYALVGAFLARRAEAAEQPDDMVGAVLSAEVGGRPITRDEQVGVVVLMFNGGLDTTRTAITNIVLNAVLDPSLQEQLRDADWLARNLDEFLRLDTPIIGLGRSVTRDVELGGQQLKAGDRLWVSYGAANRDPAQYPNPDKLDFERGSDCHTAFGLGIHRCIGSHFARLEIGIAIEELLSRVEDIRFQDAGAEVGFAPGPVRFPLSLPVTFRRRATA